MTADTLVIVLIIALIALAGCSFGPENACDGYGFKRGTTAFAQCLQSEDTTQRQVYAGLARRR